MNFDDCKNKGNDFFKNGDYAAAITEYKSALNFANLDQERLSIFKNLSACFLKLEQFEEALTFALNALEINKIDEKALFRKVKAKEGLRKYNDALKDGLALLNLYPKNTSIQETLQNLNQKVQEIVKNESSLVNRLQQTVSILNETNASEEQQVQAANNLLVLTRDKAVCPFLKEMKALHQIQNLLFKSNSFKLKLALVRVISEVCRNDVKMTKNVLTVFDFKDILDLMSTQVSVN